MASPDVSGYLDLALYDRDPQDIFDAAMDELVSRVPEYVPVEGAIEVQLLEALALQVAEAVYAINRLPGAVTQVLMQLYGIDRFIGTQPDTRVTFNLTDTLGHTVSMGTRVRLDLGAEDPVVFTTTENGLANPGQDTVTVGALGDRYTSQANGEAAGTSLTLIDALYFVDSAVLASSPANGAEPEDTTTWLDRAVARLARLTTTLALPQSFTDAAVEDPLVSRAHTLDEWNAGLDPPQNLTATPSETGGTLTHGAAYGYAVTAVTAQGETLPCATVTATIPGTDDTGSVVLEWAAPVAYPGAGAVTNYNVYRTVADGTVLGLVATVDGATLTYTSTGAGTPAAAPPITNGTGQTLPGYVTVAVYGNNEPVSVGEKATLQATLSDEALANLNVRVVDPTINTLDVTMSVVAATGMTTAQVTDDVTAVLQTLLSTASWPFDPIVRRNELISVVGSLLSVAYVDTLTSPAADVTLAGVAPLVKLGTLTLTVEGGV